MYSIKEYTRLKAELALVWPKTPKIGAKTPLTVTGSKKRAQMPKLRLFKSLEYTAA